MLKLYYALGACSLAPHIVLEEAGADYELVRLDLSAGEQRKPEYLRINPKGRVPALLTDRGALTENPAILGYVAEAFPAAKLAPLDDSFAFGDMQAFNMFLAATVHVAFSHLSRPERYAEGEVATAAMKARAPKALKEYFSLVEAKLADGRTWVHGENYTVSDPYLFLFSGWLKRDGLADPEIFPRTLAHWERVAARPAVRKVLADETGQA